MLKITIITLRTASIIFFLYFIITAYYSGIKSSFLWFYVTFSIFSMLLSFLLPVMYNSHNQILGIFGRSCVISLWVITGLFFFVQVKIISATALTPPDGADYIIVLGAQVRGQTPSLTLLSRIDSAYEYLLANPDTKVICSGGQGSGEDITEAYSISNLLIERGISRDRIILEEDSTNTIENIRNSMKYINEKEDTVVIVSSDFHIFRALSIAKKAGIKNVYGCSKRDFLVTTPGYYVREFFAVCKDFVFGNM